MVLRLIKIVACYGIGAVSYTHLDVYKRQDLLREYMECGERSILISSHISSDLESLCDDCLLYTS